MLAAELPNRQQGEIVAHEKAEDPFVFSAQMVQDLALMAFAHKVLTSLTHLRPALVTG